MGLLELWAWHDDVYLLVKVSVKRTAFNYHYNLCFLAEDMTLKVVIPVSLQLMFLCRG